MKKIIIYFFVILLVFLFVSCKQNNDNNSILPNNDSQIPVIKIMNPFGMRINNEFLIDLINSDFFQNKQRKIEEKYNCKIELIGFDENNVDEYKAFFSSIDINYFKDFFPTKEAFFSSIYDIDCSSDTIPFSTASFLNDRYAEGYFKSNEISALYIPINTAVYYLLLNNAIYDVSQYRFDYSSIYYGPLIYNKKLYGFPVSVYYNWYDYGVKFIIDDNSNYIIKSDLTFSEEGKKNSLFACGFLDFYFQYLNSKNISFASLNDGYFIKREDYLKTVDESIKLYQEYIMINSDNGRMQSPTSYLDGIFLSSIDREFINSIIYADNYLYSDQYKYCGVLPITIDNVKHYNSPTVLTDIYNKEYELDKEITDNIYGFDLSNNSYMNNIRFGDGIYILDYDLDNKRTRDFAAVVINELFDDIYGSIEDVFYNPSNERFLEQYSKENNDIGAQKEIDSIKIAIKSMACKDHNCYDSGIGLLISLQYDTTFRKQYKDEFSSLFITNISNYQYEITYDNVMTKMSMLYDCVKEYFQKLLSAT